MKIAVLLTCHNRREKTLACIRALFDNHLPIGVLMYAAILFSAGYYAINRSNNTLCKTLEIFLASHWVLFFIEDLARLDMNNYFLWFVVGLCFSNQFRALSDKELQQFFQFHYRRMPSKTISGNLKYVAKR